MSKKNTENKYKNTATANTVADIMLKQAEFCKLYSITDANMNRNIDADSSRNRVVSIVENADNAKQIIATMRLQDNFFDAVSRITVWLDETQIVIYVGAVFTVHASITAKKAEYSEKAKQYSELFNKSIDVKYNSRKRKNVTITKLTETRHCFETVADFETFFNLLAELVTARKQSTAQQADKQKASEKAQQKADNKQKAQQTSKQKAESKQKKQKAEIDADKLTKEIIDAVQQKA